MAFPEIKLDIVKKEMQRLELLHNDSLTDEDMDVSYTYGWMYHALGGACKIRVGVELRPES